MKEFLEKVPKLADLPKAMYKGKEVAVLCCGPDDFHCSQDYAIHTGVVEVIWVDEADLEPLQTHWGASEFHQFFMKHPMEECIAYKKRGSNEGIMQYIQSVSRYGLVSMTGTVWAFEDIEGVQPEGEKCVECVKEVAG